MRPGDHISCTLWDILIQQYMSNSNAPTLQSVYSCEENCRQTYTDWIAVSPETTETGVADLFYTVLFNGISSGQEENSSPGYTEPGRGGKEDHEIQRNPYRRKRLQESIEVLSGYVWNWYFCPA